MGNLKIRQGDEQTQTLVANITENGVPKPFVGLQPFFCAKLGQTAGLGIIEQKVTGPMNPANGTLEYVMQPEDWQQLGRQTAYFSFRKMVNDHEWTEQFSTRDFNYNVTKSAFSEGVKETKKDGSTYIWTIEDMLRLFKEYMASGKTDWEEFVEQNREVLESVDPGGKILGEIIVARDGAQTLGERLDESDAQLQQNALFSENTTGLLNTRKHERKPLFAFISDDGALADYTRLKPIIESKSVPFGLGIVTNWVGTNGYMSWQQIAEMNAIGCEIMSHTHTHNDLATLTEDQVLFQMKESKRILNEKGYLSSGFVYPYNSTTVVSRKLLPKYYTHGFSKVSFESGGVEGYNLNLRNFEIGRNALGSYFDKTRTGFPTDTTSYDYYKALVDDAFTTKNLLVFVVHPDATDSQQFTHLENIIDYIRLNGGEIVSPSEALSIYGNIIEVVQGSNDLILRADGTIGGSLVPIEMGATNSVTGTELATAFKQKRRTFTPINNSHATANGFPENKGGVLVTNRISSDYFTNFQEYITTLGNKKRYIRYANLDYTWGAWQHEGAETFEFSSPLTSIPANSTVNVQFTGLTGVSIGDIVEVEPKVGFSTPAGIMLYKYRTGNNSATFRFANITGTAIDLPITDWVVTVIKK